MKTLSKILLTLGMVSLSSLNLFSQESNYNFREVLFDKYKTCVPEEFRNYQITKEMEFMGEDLSSEIFYPEEGEEIKCWTREIYWNIDDDPYPDVKECYEVKADYRGKNISQEDNAPYKYVFLPDYEGQEFYRHYKKYEGDKELYFDELEYVDLKKDGLNCNEISMEDFIGEELWRYFPYRNDLK